SGICQGAKRSGTTERSRWSADPRREGNPERSRVAGRCCDRLSAGEGEVVGRFQNQVMKTKAKTKLVHEGDFVAKVPVELIETEDGWSPYLSVEDARKLDAVRNALRRGDLKSAAKLGRVFRLTPVN